MANLLAGVRVIESAQLFTGDFAGQLLADEGADVVKFESPFRGDYLRDFLGQMKPHTRGHSPLHMILNRNKRSAAVDLRTDAGKAVFWRCLEQTDVFLDGNTTGAMDALGIGYEAQRKVKPDIIYAHVTGLGATGPYARVPTHGQSMKAVAGGNPTRRTDDGYVESGNDYSNNIATVNEVVSGPLYLAFGIASALWRRATTGQGAFIDVASSDAGLSAGWMSVVNQLNSERIGRDETGMASASTGGSNSKYNLYETKDGRVMLVALIEHHFYEKFCRAIGREDLLADDVGYISKAVAIDWGPPSLRPILRDVMKSRTCDEWMALAAEHDFVVAPVNSVHDLRRDAHLVYREAIVETVHPSAGPVTMTGNPIKVAGEHYEVRHHAPALGEQTDDYLLGNGFSAAEVSDLRAAGVLGGPPKN
ncbi:MAG: CaiB/BaiF CoA transferase family protein [Acidimicrobiia bacterium]